MSNDDSTFRALASDILDHDRGAFLACDARQAFELAKRFEFSVVFIHLDLNGRDGLSLIQELRANFPGLPVIAISRVLGAP